MIEGVDLSTPYFVYMFPIQLKRDNLEAKFKVKAIIKEDSLLRIANNYSYSFYYRLI